MPLKQYSKQILKLTVNIVFCLMLQGCLGTIIGTTVDVALEVAKVPFKVGGAVIDIVSGDGEKKNKNSDDNGGDDD
ncbi:MAG: hypothetical protein ACI854_000303 [Arenicella sp.]|jgi:hypothetical protein